MENASKALLIAGGMLIAIITITLLVMMFNKIGIFYTGEDNVANNEQISKFNLEYEAYNRDDVRGTELFSLLNKAANYNDRKSNIGTEGIDIGYEPIEITINLGDNLTLFTADGEKSQLFKQKLYTEKGTRSTFRTQLKKELDDIINKYGETNLENLSKGLTKIFISSNSTETQKEEAVYNYNKLSKTAINNFSDIKENSQIRKDVYKYYEYVQFKRAHFKCTKSNYNKKTGRIVKMEFEFTGKFE